MLQRLPRRFAGMMLACVAVVFALSLHPGWARADQATQRDEMLPPLSSPPRLSPEARKAVDKINWYVVVGGADINDLLEQSGTGVLSQKLLAHAGITRNWSVRARLLALSMYAVDARNGAPAGEVFLARLAAALSRQRPAAKNDPDLAPFRARPRAGDGDLDLHLPIHKNTSREEVPWELHWAVYKVSDYAGRPDAFGGFENFASLYCRQAGLGDDCDLVHARLRAPGPVGFLLDVLAELPPEERASTLSRWTRAVIRAVPEAAQDHDLQAYAPGLPWLLYDLADFGGWLYARAWDYPRAPLVLVVLVLAALVGLDIRFEITSAPDACWPGWLVGLHIGALPAAALLLCGAWEAEMLRLRPEEYLFLAVVSGSAVLMAALAALIPAGRCITLLALALALAVTATFGCTPSSLFGSLLLLAVGMITGAVHGRLHHDFNTSVIICKNKIFKYIINIAMMVADAAIALPMIMAVVAFVLFIAAITLFLGSYCPAMGLAFLLLFAANDKRE